MLADRLRIFISYAHADGVDLARVLCNLLNKTHDAWLDLNRLQAGEEWTAVLERQIDACDVALVILSKGYNHSEICRAEIGRAKRKRKRVIPVLAQMDADRLLFLENTQFINFATQDFDSAFAALQTHLITGNAELRTSEQDPVVVTGAPPVLVNRAIIDRPTELNAVRRSLLDGQGETVAITAIKGQGGIGKSVLAALVYGDEVIRQAFPGGIFWIEIGQYPNLRMLGQRVIARLGAVDLNQYPDEGSCKVRYRELLRDRAALVILDDVWSKDQVEFFATDSPGSRVLFTTRNVGIATSLHADIHPLDLLSDVEARKLLAIAAECSEEDLPIVAQALIRECGSLPLAISQLGAAVRGGDQDLWHEVLDAMHRVDVRALGELLAEGESNPFFKVSEVSFRRLDESLQEKYRALALLKSLPMPMLETLWGVSSAEARRAVKQLSDRSLAQFVDGVLILHDLQFDYIRALHQDRPMLDCIEWAIRLSEHVVANDVYQFVSQWTGRLIPHIDQPTVAELLNHLKEHAPRPWLRPLWPALEAPGETPLLRTLAGHTAPVNSVAISPNGKWIVSASSDKTLRVWDAMTGAELRSLNGHSHEVMGVAVTQDGTRAVSASSDKTLKVWDLSSGMLLATMQARTTHRTDPVSVGGTITYYEHVVAGHHNSVLKVSVSADGMQAVSASSDNTLIVWDLRGGGVLLTLVGHSGCVRDVTISPDGRRVVSASDDKTLKVWDLAGRTLLHTLEGHSGCVLAVALSPDGARAVSASQDTTVKVWDLSAGSLVTTLTGHTASVNGVAMSPDGTQVISASDDKTLKVWDLARGTVQTLRGHSGGVYAAVVTPDGTRAISASDDNRLRVWDLKFKALRPPSRHSGGVMGVAVNSDGTRAISASADKTLKIWDLKSGESNGSLERHTDRVNCVAMSLDGTRAVSGSDDKTLKVWDLSPGKLMPALMGYKILRALTRHKLLSPLTGYKLLRTIAQHTGPVGGVAISPDGTRIVSASSDNTLKVFELTTGSLLHSLRGHKAKVTSVAITSNGKLVVSGSEDGTLMVWNLKRGKLKMVLRGHTGGVLGVATTPDQTRAVSASDDCSVKVWNLSNFELISTLRGHSAAVQGVAVSPNGTQAVSVSQDYAVKLWNLGGEKCIATYSCDAVANCCAFAGESHIIAGDADGRMHYLAIEL